MGMHRYGYKFLFLLSFIFFACPASAQVPDLEPLNYKLLYSVKWNNITIGRIRVTMKEDRFGYSMKVDTKTSGIARLFSSEVRLAEALGRINERGDYIHSFYDSRTYGDEKGKHATVKYDENGDIVSRERVPMEKPTWRPEVPIEEANTATDPITAFFEFRKQMHRNISNNIRETSMRTYEGARLATMNFTVVSRASTEIKGKYQNTINTVIKRAPINGYTPKELKKYKEGDPAIHAYWSADGRFLPLKLEIMLGFGSIAATLEEIKGLK